MGVHFVPIRGSSSAFAGIWDRESRIPQRDERLGQYFMGVMSERRCFARTPCTGTVEMLQNGNPCGWGKVNDISLCGCYLESVHPLPVGTEVQLRLTVAGSLLEIGARVVGTTPQVGMAMYFTFVSPEQEGELAQIIEEVSAIGHSSAVRQAGPPQPGKAAVRISRDAELLAKIAKRIDQKGVLTKQEFFDMLKNQP
jgi:PilZ domain